MALTDLVYSWRAKADELAPYATGAAEAFRRAAVELEAALNSATTESVTLKEAHLLGGYSIDHLQRLLTGGQLENVGRKHRPRIRRGDVPIKPGHVLPSDREACHFSDRRRIVASVTTGHTEAS